MKQLIKPAREGLLVRKANGERLKPEGETLTANAWWYRRRAEGDVTITDIKTEQAQPVTQSSKPGEKK